MRQVRWGSTTQHNAVCVCLLCMHLECMCLPFSCFTNTVAALLQLPLPALYTLSKCAHGAGCCCIPPGSHIPAGLLLLAALQQTN
jgi:hypothetical protein